MGYEEAGNDTAVARLIRPARGGRIQRCCAIAVMAKASRPGLVKTRLVPPLSHQEAADLNTAFLADIVANIAAAAETRAIDAFFAFGPPGASSAFTGYGAEVGLIEIWHRDFGQCLSATIAQLLAMGYDSACVLNSDSPTLPTARLIEMADHLARPGDRAVLGPSVDGGYYILGIKALHRRLFEDIAWSTEAVARQTRERAAEIGLEVIELEPWYDVDDAATLGMLIDELGTDAKNGSFDAPATAKLVATLDAEPMAR